MKNKIALLVLILVFGFAAWMLGGQTTNAQADASAAAPVNQLIVKYQADANLTQAAQAQEEAQMQRLSAAAGMELTYFRPMSGDAHVLRLSESVPAEQALEISAQLSALPEVEYAEPDYIMFPLGESGNLPLMVPNDPQYTNQWHYSAPVAGSYGVNAPAAWDITTGNSGVYVAVLDTGILNHTDLVGRWQGGYDMISDSFVANDGDARDANPQDPGDWVAADECGYSHSAQDSSWHGTHVAGTIGASTDNGVGVAGLNWVSKVIPVRVLGKCGGYTSDIADGIRWAAGYTVSGVPDNPTPVQVINMSLGGLGTCGTTSQNAINDAVAAGTTVVVAAGNDSSDASGFSPASCNNVITVAATNRDGGMAYYSNYGSVVEISAPGGAQSYANDPNGVLSTLNTGTQGPVADSYEYYQGTSMAAPHVAGIASLLYSVNPALTPAQVLSTLQNTVTAFPGGSSCNTSLCGSGIVNAGAALASITDVPPAAPVLSTISNPDGDGDYTVDWNDVATATSYTLQEDDNSSFTSPTAIYTGAASQYDVTGQADGTWYYRAMATNTYGDSSWSSWKSVFVGDTRSVYLPLVLKQEPPPSGPTPGLWEGSGMEFYVTTDSAYVDDFAIWVYVDGCGTLKITRISPLNPITNDQFSFTGPFYASGTFSSETSASGVTGLSNYDSYFCGIISGGPWNWSATWSNSSQPTVFQAEMTPATVDELVPSVDVPKVVPFVP